MIVSLAVVAALALPACGDSDVGGASDLSGAVAGNKSVVPTSTGRATRLPTTVVSVTNATSPSTSRAATTTTAPAPPRVVGTRNPPVAEPERFVAASELLEGAISLPDGSVLVAVRSLPEGSLCSATIWRVDAKSSARTYFANGREPQLSPDGHTVAYASVRRIGEGEHSCGALDMGVRDLGTGSDRVIRIGDADTSAGVVALHLLWSPNGRKVAMWIGIDRSESADSMLVDLGTATAARVRVASDVEAVFNYMPACGCRTAHSSWARRAATAWPTWLASASRLGGTRAETG